MSRRIKVSETLSFKKRTQRHNKAPTSPTYGCRKRVANRSWIGSIDRSNHIVVCAIDAPVTRELSGHKDNVREPEGKAKDECHEYIVPVPSTSEFVSKVCGDGNAHHLHANHLQYGD
mmetsp:Transcript_18229/g.49730  ORF Transcript_18229/g.49730 Transcript_18229/m.49730 type:complete len:117 (-) Transcript_18229:2866-3216(-)